MSALLERQKEFAGYLANGFPELGLKGWPRISAAAVTGNASQENLVKPVTEGQKDHGSDGALQWRLSRLDGPTGLKGWAASHGLPWDTLKTEAAFTIYEVERDYPRLNADLRAGTKRIETLTANFMAIYERPAAQYANLDNRIKAARDTYAAISDEPLPAPAPAPTLPPAMQNVTGSPYSTWFGLAALAYAYICYHQPQFLGMPTLGDPMSLLLLGVYLVFKHDAPREDVKKN